MLTFFTFQSKNLTASSDYMKPKCFCFCVGEKNLYKQRYSTIHCILKKENTDCCIFFNKNFIFIEKNPIFLYLYFFHISFSYIFRICVSVFSFSRLYFCVIQLHIFRNITPTTGTSVKTTKCIKHSCTYPGFGSKELDFMVFY